MAKDKEVAAQGADLATSFVRPETNKAHNLNQQYPLYKGFLGGKDGKSAKPGEKGVPIHGYLLGIVELPSVLEDDNGEKRDWNCFVIELLQPCIAKAAGDEAEAKWYDKGTRIALNIGTSLQKPQFLALAQDADKVHEVLIEPEVTRVKSNKMRSLWIYPGFFDLSTIKRLPQHQVSVPTMGLPRSLAGANGTSGPRMAAPVGREMPEGQFEGHGGN